MAASLTLLFFVTSILYASVGHGGASGYLAVMALMGLTPDVMKPTALILNILTSGIATIKFYQAKHFDWRVFGTFAIASFPCAFLGGKLSLPDVIYKPIVGLVLLYAAVSLLKGKRLPTETSNPQKIPLAIAILAGMGIGFLSGLTGVGGGIFLSPLLILTSWTSPKTTAGVSAAFILVNSMAGLLGLGIKVSTVPKEIIFWGLAVSLGGWIGAQYGSQKVNNINLQRLLGVVLIIASWKMLSVLFSGVL
ncbi:hypothetical protein C7B64_03170 [Merismopedia glauca CCAP 1448/3]|uniref:Probable membrane transporter protein n=1 Tax=Merismopedia glauca CCAP 1448/3 TaxID=1296344 RepID=A0A2T1C8N7_9CYAN|nr:hypothetical protein C7B64_03170 [Merismopedia glauca CCAP 1448/3]